MCARGSGSVWVSGGLGARVRGVAAAGGRGGGGARGGSREPRGRPQGRRLVFVYEARLGGGLFGSSARSRGEAQGDGGGQVPLRRGAGRGWGQVPRGGEEGEAGATRWEVERPGAPRRGVGGPGTLWRGGEGRVPLGRERGGDRSPLGGAWGEGTGQVVFLREEGRGPGTGASSTERGEKIQTGAPYAGRGEKGQDRCPLCGALAKGQHQDSTELGPRRLCRTRRLEAAFSSKPME